MRLKTFTLLVICLSLSMNSSLFGRSTANEMFRVGSMKSISKISRKEAKPIMVFVSGENCTNSKRMSEVFRRKAVSTFLGENFVCKEMDGTNIFNVFKASNWGVNTIPSYVFLTSKGEVVYVVSGYKKADKMIEEAQTALELMKDQNNIIQ